MMHLCATKKGRLCFFPNCFFPVQVHGDSKMTFSAWSTWRPLFCSYPQPTSNISFSSRATLENLRLPRALKCMFVVYGDGKKKLPNQIWFSGRNE
jgi:hypothetical protein